MMAGVSRCAACGGYTLIELVVVVTVIGVASALLMQRLFLYLEIAEKASMESTVRVVKTGLQLRLAELMLANRQAEAGELETSDPMRWLAERPANYAGAYRSPPDRGSWYFDVFKRELVYVVSNGAHLEVVPTDGHKQIRFRIRLIRDRVRMGGGPVESVTGVALIPVVRYTWSEPAARTALIPVPDLIHIRQSG